MGKVKKTSALHLEPVTGRSRKHPRNFGTSNGKVKKNYM
jgi:hypothetical protein